MGVTVSLETDDRYFAILQAAMFSSGVIRSDGTVLTHEQVVDRLNEWVLGPVDC